MSETTTTTARTNLTPYRAAQVMTRQFRKLGLIDADEEIGPQTMYSNKSIKRVPGSKKKSEGGEGILFDGDSFFQYLQNEVAARRGGTRVRTKVNVDRLAEQFNLDDDNVTAVAPVNQTDDETEALIAAETGDALLTEQGDAINNSTGPLTDEPAAAQANAEDDEDAELAALEAEENTAE